MLVASNTSSSRLGKGTSMTKTRPTAATGMIHSAAPFEGESWLWRFVLGTFLFWLWILGWTFLFWTPLPGSFIGGRLPAAWFTAGVVGVLTGMSQALALAACWFCEARACARQMAARISATTA